MEKVKSFLFVKNQNETVEAIESLERTLTTLLESFIGKSNEADLLKRKEESLEQVIYSLKKEVLAKITKMEDQTSKIEIVRYKPINRPPDRLKLYEEIESEIKTLNDNHYTEQQDMMSKISMLEMDVKRLKEQLLDCKAKLNKKVLTENKGIQVELEIEEKAYLNDDEIKTYYENINYFVVGGKLRKLEWATFLITDIFNSKLRADYDDFRAGRSLCSLREYILQYFLKKFECRRAGITLLRDFFFTLSQRFQESLRIETFLLLCEANPLRSKLNVDMGELMRKNKLSFKIYGLPSTCSLYIELAFNLKKMKSNESVFFMPNDDHNGSYLIKKTDAEEFAEKAFRKLKIKETSILEAMAKFDRVVKTDLAVRVVHNKVTGKDENEKNRYISFDALLE